METAVRSENADLAGQLDHIAELLEAQKANPFRVHAYRHAADTVRACPEPVTDRFAREGIDGLLRMPGIGRSISSLIREYARSGRISVLGRLEGAVSTEDVLARVPGLGPTLAHRVHESLGAESLEELEYACFDGRLAALEGFGPRRVAAITASVRAMLDESGRRRAQETGDARRPSVVTLLAVDETYRRRAEAGELARIAPRRFNPEGRAWLPILHTDAEGWQLTALYSNTARAHRLGKTREWVVIYADRDGMHDQATVVNERRRSGVVRIVRGRERECDAQRLGWSGPERSTRTDSTTPWSGNARSGGP